MEGKLFRLYLDGTSITAQDVIKYLTKQFEKLAKEERSKVRSTRWLRDSYFARFGNYTSDVATHETVFSLFHKTKKEMDEIINKRRDAVLTAAGAGLAGLITYLLTSEEDRPIVVPTAALLGGLVTNAMVKR